MYSLPACLVEVVEESEGVGVERKGGVVGVESIEGFVPEDGWFWIYVENVWEESGTTPHVRE